MTKRTPSVILLLLFSLLLPGQRRHDLVKDSIVSRIIEQVLLYPQDKVHLHTDKPVYIAGETVWFRAWVTDAVLHTPVSERYVFTELVSPSGTVVSRVKLRQEEGAFGGHLNLDPALPEGNYTLSAYTENMLNNGADYLFRRQIRIEGPLSATMKTNVDYSFGKDDRVTAEITFNDLRTGRRIRPDAVRISHDTRPAAEIKMTDDTVVQYTFILPAESNRRLLYIETDRSSEFLPVPFSADDYEIYFYPEGGYLPHGTGTVVAFRALRSDGMPEDITGLIVDSAGEIYDRFETVHEGMGSFFLAPGEGKNYFALCTNSSGLKKRFELPVARRGICTLSAERAGDTLYVSVLQAVEPEKQQELYLVLHTRGMLHYAAPWDSSFSTLFFDTGKFPSGILQVLLFDGEMRPLSERLVFIRNDDQATTEFRTARESYKKRQQVNAAVRVTGPDGSPLEGSFSVSVTDDNDIKPDTSVTILTSLLLTSELKGHINNPAFYFEKNNPLAGDALDLLMMVNGWRRYDIPAVLNGRYVTPDNYPGQGMEITGGVRSLILGKPVEKAVVAAFSWNAGYYEETETDSEGRFAFRGIEFRDSTEFILQALTRKGGAGVELLPGKERFAPTVPLPLTAVRVTGGDKKDEDLSAYVAKADTKYTMEKGMRTVYIEGVVIKAKAPERKDYGYSFYMPKSDKDVISAREIEELQPVFLTDIIRYLPHIEIVTDSNGLKKAIIQRMSYRMTGPQYNYAALIVDDIIIHDYDLDMINPLDIERIGVLRGTQAIMLGSDATGGAIVVTTKKGNSSEQSQPRHNIAIITPLGYQAPVEFYSPRYETELQRNSGPPDLRTTVCWNPNVTITADGEAEFDFYTADSKGTYTVIIEGVTSDGLIIRSKNSISVL